MATWHANIGMRTHVCIVKLPKTQARGCGHPGGEVSVLRTTNAPSRGEVLVRGVDDGLHSEVLDHISAVRGSMSWDDVSVKTQLVQIFLKAWSASGYNTVSVARSFCCGAEVMGSLDNAAIKSEPGLGMK